MTTVIDITPFRRRMVRSCLFSLLPVVIVLAVSTWAHAVPVPGVSHIALDSDGDSTSVSSAMKVVILFTVLSLAPAILLSMTSFTRLIVVFSFLRTAIGTQSMPPNQIMIGLALFLTFFIMSPVLGKMNEESFQPFMAGEISEVQAMDRAAGPLRQFMLRQTREDDIALFYKVTQYAKPQTASEIPMHILIPAYMITELKTSFQMGFMVYVPFLVVDMVTASTLMAMGMMMLPPIIISLPFKIALFVLVDGWHLLITSLVDSFHVAS